MATPSNGITAEVVQEMMTVFRLSDDLIDSILTAIPPPPDNASSAWRQGRIERIIAETTAFLPADAAQGRLVAQIIIARDVADDTLRRSHAPALTVEQVCRLRRTAEVLGSTAARLEQALARRQQKPTPFWGNVAPDGLDVVVLEASWWAKVQAGRGNGLCGADATEGVGVGQGPGSPVQPGAAPGADAGEASPSGLTAPPPAAAVSVQQAGADAQACPADQRRPAAGSRASATSDGPAQPPGMAPDAQVGDRPGVTVEHGDGWTLEVWRPGAGAAAMARRASRDRTAEEAAMAAPAASPGTQRASDLPKAAGAPMSGAGSHRFGGLAGMA